MEELWLCDVSDTRQCRHKLDYATLKSCDDITRDVSYCDKVPSHRTNTLAYYENYKITAVKSFVTSAPDQTVASDELAAWKCLYDKQQGDNVRKTFFFAIDISSEISWSVCAFQACSKPGTCQRGEHLNGAPLVWAPALFTDIKLGCEAK
jgi:hypothetical protein